MDRSCTCSYCSTASASASGAANPNVYGWQWQQLPVQPPLPNPVVHQHFSTPPVVNVTVQDTDAIEAIDQLGEFVGAEIQHLGEFVHDSVDGALAVLHTEIEKLHIRIEKLAYALGVEQA